jgi:hypothetical protein
MKHVSPHPSSRLAVNLFAPALIIPLENAARAITLNSPAFQQNDHIPSRYTCEGEDISPPLAWEDVPTGAKSLALIIDMRPIRKHPRWFGYIGSSTTYGPIPRVCPRTQARQGCHMAPYSGSMISRRRDMASHVRRSAGTVTSINSIDLKGAIKSADRPSNAGPRTGQCSAHRHLSKG